MNPIENKAHVIKNPITYQGTFIFPFFTSCTSSSTISSLVLCFIWPNISTTTTNNITLTILNIVERSFTLSFTMAPLATTWPTDCNVPPINADVGINECLYKNWAIIGSKNIKNIPVTLTIVIAIPFSLSSASITGAVAAIADDPQTALPLAIINLKFCPNPSFFPIYKAPTIVIVIWTIINNIPPAPNSIKVEILNVAPNRTIEYDKRSVSENLYPFWKISWLKNKFPTSIPKNIDIVAAPNLGTNLDKKILNSPMHTDTKSPGSISFIFFII